MTSAGRTTPNAGWLPFRWSSAWCLVGLHNPVYVFDHEAGEPTYKCWGCQKELSRG